MLQNIVLEDQEHGVSIGSTLARTLYGWLHSGVAYRKGRDHTVGQEARRTLSRG